jgi:hypothetical protein
MREAGYGHREVELHAMLSRDHASMLHLRPLPGVLALVGLLLAAGVSTSAYISPWQDRAAPELASTTWLNSVPLTLRELRGKVVLLEFWTYG